QRLFLGMLDSNQVQTFFGLLLQESPFHAFRAIPDCHNLSAESIRKMVNKRPTHTRLQDMAELGRRWCVYASQADGEKETAADTQRYESLETSVALATIEQWLASDFDSAA